MSAFVRKKAAASDCTPVAAVSREGAFSRAYPALWEYMTLLQFEDGSPRKTTTVKLFLGDYGLQGMIDDRENEQVAFVTADSLESVFQALETGLREGRLDWRASFTAKKKGGRK